MATRACPCSGACCAEQEASALGAEASLALHSCAIAREEREQGEGAASRLEWPGAWRQPSRSPLPPPLPPLAPPPAPRTCAAGPSCLPCAAPCALRAQGHGQGSRAQFWGQRWPTAQAPHVRPAQHQESPPHLLRRAIVGGAHPLTPATQACPVGPPYKPPTSGSRSTHQRPGPSALRAPPPAQPACPASPPAACPAARTGP